MNLPVELAMTKDFINEQLGNMYGQVVLGEVESLCEPEPLTRVDISTLEL